MLPKLPIKLWWVNAHAFHKQDDFHHKVQLRRVLLIYCLYAFLLWKANAIIQVEQADVPRKDDPFTTAKWFEKLRTDGILVGVGGGSTGEETVPVITGQVMCGYLS